MKIKGLAAVIVVLAAIASSFAYLETNFIELFSRTSLAQMAKFANGFLTPDFSRSHLYAIAWACLETLAMSAMGTLLAALFGIILALPAAGRLGTLFKAVAR